MNVRFLAKNWSIVVQEIKERGVVTVYAENHTLKAGVCWDIPIEEYRRTSLEHRDRLVKSTAALALIYHADQLSNLIGLSCDNAKQAAESMIAAE